MSRINGEKARAAVNRKRRTAQRVKDRAKVQEIRLNASTNVEQSRESAPKSDS